MYIAKDYLEIGNNCYLGKTLLTNHLWGENLFVKKIKIKDNVVISDGSTISPGSCIDSNVNIFPLSFTLKSEDLNKKARYYDIPLNQLSEKDLMKKFNLALNETDGEIKND
jgi:acetyltransferase-like isoleucine patch superfamily enzyme